MVPGREDVGHGKVREGGLVPEIIHPGDRSLSFQECGRPGPTA